MKIAGIPLSGGTPFISVGIDIGSFSGLGRVNETSAVRALQAFAHLDLMEEEYHLPLAGLLADLLGVFDPAGNPVVYNTIRRLLLGAPGAFRAYEAKFGPVKGLHPDGQ